MASIQEAKAYLTRVKTTLERPLTFYQAHAEKWKEEAATVARATLLQLRPETIGEEPWAEAIETTLGTVTAELIDEDVVGLHLWMLRVIVPGMGKGTPYETAIPFEAIVEWVAAGRAGEDGGKRIMDAPGERDYDARTGGSKTDRAIAWRVFHALRLKYNPRLQAAILRWMGANGPPQILLVLDAVQTAWDEYFAAQAPLDFTAWVRRVAAEWQG